MIRYREEPAEKMPSMLVVLSMYCTEKNRFLVFKFTVFSAILSSLEIPFLLLIFKFLLTFCSFFLSR